MNTTDIEELTLDREDVEEEDEEASNYQLPSYILRNLDIANDAVAADPSYGLQSRNITCDITCYQLLYYLSLTLKSFANNHGGSKQYPCILLVGPGFLGSRLIEKIVENNCAPILNVYTRGDIASKYWISKGVRASNSIKRLIKKHKIDILILCTSVSAFPSIARKLDGYLTRQTAVLSASIGLPNRRIYNQWRTPSIFRIYQEPERVIKRVKEECIRVGSEQHLEMEGFANIQNIELETISNYSLSRISLTDENLSYCEYSADLLATRVGDICHLIFILENYYSLRGCPHDVARIDALSAIIGYTTAPTELPHVTSESMPTKAHATPVRDQLFKNVLKSLHDNIVSFFQQQLSRYIRIIDLPKVTTYTGGIRTQEANDVSVIEETEPVPVHEDQVILRIFDENAKLQTKDEDLERLLREFESDDDEEDKALFMEFGSHDTSMLKNPRNISAHVLQSAYDAFIPEFIDGNGLDNSIDEDNDSYDGKKEENALKSKDSSPNKSPVMAQHVNTLSRASPVRKKSIIVFGTKGIQWLSKQERDARERKMNERATALLGLEIGGVPLPISPRSSTASPLDRVYNVTNEQIVPMEAIKDENVALVITSYGSSKNDEGGAPIKKIIEISGDMGNVNVTYNKDTESSRVLNDLSVNAGNSEASKDVDIDENELLDTFV